MAYRLRTDVLRRAAAACGDLSVRRIIANTGLPRTVVQRSLAGQNEPSIGTLMRFRKTYGVPVEELIREVEETPAS
jgi:DNA-binding phage protein